jgi:hypothetical protein
MTASIVAIARAGAEPSDRELLMRALDEIAALRAEVDALKPAKRFTIPPGWVPIKKASGSFAPSTIHQWARERKVMSIKVGGRRYIDPSSLPKRT